MNVSLADELLGSSNGVALLHHLELAERHLPFGSPDPLDSDPAAVDRAMQRIAMMAYDDLLAHVLDAADEVNGPWSPRTLDVLPIAFELADARRAIADAVVARFGDRLGERIDLACQEWWWSRHYGDTERTLFRALDRTYCCGEFSWGGLWTVGPTPSDIHERVLHTWELYGGETTRWHAPITETPCIAHIDHPSDWAELVARHPDTSRRSHAGHELPGINQQREDRAVSRLEAASGGHAVRRTCRVAMPDWRSVADEFDGVHLSWAGFLTCEGTVVGVPELGDDVVSMVRYWGSERTHWLRDIFGTFEPLSAPVLAEGSQLAAADVRNEPTALARWAHLIESILGR